MNLIIDIGNTFAKIAVMDAGQQLQGREVHPELTSAIIERYVSEYGHFDGVILSTTRHTDTATEEQIKTLTSNFIHFDSQTPVPLVNMYESPTTLGADRMAAAVGAWHAAPDSEILIVDLGSAITIDRVSHRGEYLGGNISPGMAMRFEALHRLTDRLPLCTHPDTLRHSLQVTSKSTRSAIENGVVQGIIFEIEGYISRISQEKSPLNVFFTGRDAKYFADNVKKPIFVLYDLVFQGLSLILDYNTNPR